MQRPSRVVLPVVAWLGLVPGGTAQSVLHTWTGAAGEPFFGQALASLGDVDGDGVRDVAVGDPFGAGFKGRVAVYSGLDGSLLHENVGTTPGAEFGAAIAACGDLDGDGIGDLAIGVPNVGSGAGRVRVVSGSSGATLIELDGVAPDTHFGAALAAAGDVDGDGLDDLWVGAPDETSDRRGAVHLLSGADGSELFVAFGVGKDDRLGAAVAGGVDVNGDGVLDGVAGAPQTPLDPGYLRVLSGLDGSVLLEVAGDNPDDGFGSAVALLPDVTGDGLGDVLAGAPGVDLSGVDRGAAVVVSGATGHFAHLVGGAADGDRLGSSVTCLGDVDEDGDADYAAGTDRLEGGEAHVHSGNDGALIHAFDAYPAAPATLGSGVTVARAGDLNGDGRADLLVGGLSRLVSPEPGTVQAISVATAPWIDLGQALPGAAGLPQLEGEGSLIPGTPFTLRVSGGEPFGLATLVLGYRSSNTPFKGGTMVPSPDVLNTGLLLDASGSLEVLGMLPEDTHAGTSVVYQVWMDDQGALAGLAATNGLAAVTTD